MNQTSAPQEAVFRFLSDPKTHGDGAVRRIDTHAASVFLVGDRAFKVKRAVRFPFLDYSTLEKRKAACEAELEVNRAIAPNVYRRVVPITRGTGGALALGGDGEPVDWAVEMRRFDETATLDHLAGRRMIGPALADELGRLVAAMQEREPIVPGAPWIAALETYIGTNTQAFGAQPDWFASAEVKRLDGSSRERLARVRPLLGARGEAGLVRRGHGDLHLGNIALIDGKPVPFDAIEFDPLIATGDILYELAFLLMDLVERALPATANVVFNRYLAQTRRDADLDGLAALPLFLSIRAAVRAMVTAARASRAEEDRKAMIASAQRYFEWALTFIAPPRPVLIAVGGLSGTGKSLLARAVAPDFAPAPGAVVLRSDVERKILFGKGETERLPNDAYMPDVTARVYASLNAKARRALVAGHSVVVDAVFARDAERAAVSGVARACGADFRGLFLTTDLLTRLARVGTRVADASDADAMVVRKQESYEVGALDWEQIDASGTPDATLARARAALR